MLKPSAGAAGVSVAAPDAPNAPRCVLCQAELPPGASRRVNGQQVCAVCASQVEKELAASKGSAFGFLPAAVGGLVGAVAGGLAWAAIAIMSGYEIGYVAVLVGWLAGHGVRI